MVGYKLPLLISYISLIALVLQLKKQTSYTNHVLPSGLLLSNGKLDFSPSHHIKAVFVQSSVSHSSSLTAAFLTPSTFSSAFSQLPIRPCFVKLRRIFLRFPHTPALGDSRLEERMWSRTVIAARRDCEFQLWREWTLMLSLKDGWHSGAISLILGGGRDALSPKGHIQLQLCRYCK